MPPSRRVFLAGSVEIAAAAALGRRVGAASRVPPPDPDAGLRTVAVFGAAGSFGGSAAVGVDTVAVAGWSFGPGQAAFMSAVSSDGTVFVGTTPFTDDQSRPTGDTMDLVVYEPPWRRFTRLTVPSTTGRTVLPRPGANFRGVGGGDVADVAVAPGAGGDDTAVFVSAMPYFGWNTRTMGQLPTFGQVRRDQASGDWRYDAGRSRTADALAASLPSSEAAQAFPHLGPSQPRSGRGAAAIARLPRSGHVVVAQYFGSDLTGGRGQGALLVVDLAGQVRAYYQYPAVHVFGDPVVVRPREVVADPSSAADDERFVLISDCWTGGQTTPFGVQEFAYHASAGTIVPRSTTARAAQDGSRMETATIGPDGTLYVARTAADGISAAPLAVYPKVGGERGLVTRTPAYPGWEANAWGMTNPPDHLVPGTDRGGLVRSIVCDQATGTVFVAGLSGLLQAVAPGVGAGASRTYGVVREVDLRLDQLRATTRHRIGLRRGALDAARGVLWIPANQMVLSDQPWPFAPFPLNQWLYRVDIRRLLA